MLYLVLKLVHIAAVVLFLGNIITGVFWKRHADRSRDARLSTSAMEGIIRSDRLFTIPGVVLIVAAGIAAAMRAGFPILRTGWILWALVSFILSGWAFMAQVAPLQRKLLAAASAGATAGDGSWWHRYEDLSRGWDFWGAISLVLSLLAMASMVLKPGIPGLPL